MKIKRIASATFVGIAAVATVLGVGAVTLSSPRIDTYAEEGQANTPAVWLQISPVSNRVSLSKGGEYDYSFTVSNIGSEAFGYHVYAAPYSITSEDYAVSFSTETNRTQVARWIKFHTENGEYSDTASFKIEPGETQSVSYRITVPDDIPDGGQYACIFAESDETEGSVSGSGIKTVSRVGLIVYGRTDGNTVDKAEIKDVQIPGFMTSGKITTESKVINAGNTDFEAVYSLNIKSIFGRQLYEKNNSYNVLPDTERRVHMDWEGTPFMGIFQVHYVVRALDQIEETTRLVVIMPIFVIVLSIILLTLIIIWIIILIRKRRERKSRLLV